MENIKESLSNSIKKNYYSEVQTKSKNSSALEKKTSAIKQEEDVE
jgi:hypothetical protein